MKMYDFDGAAHVKTTLTDMSKARRDIAASKVKSKTPKFAVEEVARAEAV
jgi:hypothetical protein